MRVWRGHGEVGDVGPCAVTIGNFDGVHRGHAMLAQRTAARARERGHLPVAMTFDPHPLSVVRPDRAPLMITTLADRLRLLGEAGIEAVLVLPFDEEMAALKKAPFAQLLLVETLHTSVVVVGADFHFGAQASGNVPYLREVGQRFGFEVDDVEVQTDGEGRFSSTRVRELIAAGDVAGAAEILGRFHHVTGPVIEGERRGRELGFPTANLACPPGLALPADGVYAGRLADPEFGSLPAAISVGSNPTFGGGLTRRVEAYVLDRTDLDLYGRVVTVSFVAKLRDMAAFDSVESLIDQMNSDVDETRRLVSPN
ncbi:MAG: bifunctional riboflavin kinase/FAD synthetase [Sporichthyaceae bacterium]